MPTSAVRHSFDGIETLDVTSDAASIVVDETPSSDATTVVTFGDRSGNALPDELLELVQDGSVLRITVRTVREGRWKRNRNVDARLHVATPASVGVEVNTGAGSVRVDRREAPVTVVAHVGSIKLIKVSGAIDVRSSAGSVKLTDTQGIATISSEAGAVSVDRHRGEQLDLRTSAGSVKGIALEVARITASTEAGSVRLAFATPPVDVEATCSVGAVTVELPQDDYEIEQHVGGLGRARLDGIASVAGASRKVRVASNGVGSVTVTAAAGHPTPA